MLQRHLGTTTWSRCSLRVVCGLRVCVGLSVANEYTDGSELRVAIYATTSETGLGGRRTPHPRSSAREGDLPHVSGHRAVSGGPRSLTKQEPRGASGPSFGRARPQPSACAATNTRPRKIRAESRALTGT